ncbi:MAG TPA: DinB family protein [Phycisphaerae bacterium]|nr:DinB family protein [Phycisphaerae bacterium]
MDLKSFLVSSLERSPGMLKMTVADMSDAELNERPVEGANTPNWQIGHLISAEASLFASIGMPKFALPAGFEEAYARPKPGVTPGKPFAKEQLVSLLEQVNAAAVAWARTLNDEQLAAPTAERMRAIAPTTADLINLITSHNAMHVGQIQVMRRKLGKPILF